MKEKKENGSRSYGHILKKKKMVNELIVDQ